MIGIVIVAHGGLAGEYLSAMEHVVGKRPGTISVAVGPDDNAETKQDEIDDAVAAVDDGDGVIIVTDMFGGTPSNLAVCACNTSRHRVLYGVNMPLLIKLAKTRHLSLDEAVASALTTGRKYINSLAGFDARAVSGAKT
ncbi:PTS sugar transporter subunit IIA [Amaricoccus tamworthensis]|uniref:PTS sugar transporter subunit IIA n=1 Tax=Amaricoccus tamworthensis TaxID=57002 RepID=UPI003C7A7DD3